MYTVCFVDGDGKDRWERCDTLEEAKRLLKRERADADYIIFPPAAEDMAMFGIFDEEEEE